MVSEKVQNPRKAMFTRSVFSARYSDRSNMGSMHSYAAWPHSSSNKIPWVFPVFRLDLLKSIFQITAY